MSSSHTQTVYIATALIVGFLGGIGSGYALYAKNEDQMPPLSQRLDSDQYRFTNPLLDNSDADAYTLLNRNIRDLKERIETITKIAIDNGSIRNGSVYYRDLNNGPWLLTGEQHEYKPASLFKVPLMIAFFKEAERNPQLLEQTITYDTPFENVPQHNVDSSSETITFGQSYTVLNLIERMIIYSDNYAAYLLLQHIDANIVTNVFHDLDVPIEGIEHSLLPFGPRTYASFLRVLYNGTYINKEYSEKALEILSRSTFNHGMRSSLPDNTRASIKYGIAVNNDGTKQLHECGIVYWQDKSPYLLCIMSTGDDYTRMSSFIQNVTSDVQQTIKTGSQ